MSIAELVPHCFTYHSDNLSCVEASISKAPRKIPKIIGLITRGLPSVEQFPCTMVELELDARDGLEPVHTIDVGGEGIGELRVAHLKCGQIREVPRRIPRPIVPEDLALGVRPILAHVLGLVILPARYAQQLNGIPPRGVGTDHVGHLLVLVTRPTRPLEVALCGDPESLIAAGR
jgi:hypothetical protein